MALLDLITAVADVVARKGDADAVVTAGLAATGAQRATVWPGVRIPSDGQGPVAEAIRSGEAIFRAADGATTLWLPLVGPRGRVGALELVFEGEREPTAEERAVFAILRAEQAEAEARLLYDTTAAVNQAEDLSAIYDPALDGLCAALRISRAAILLFDRAGRDGREAVMRFKAWRGLSDAYRAVVEGHSPWKADATAAEAIVVEDVFADPGLAPFADAFRAEGIRSLAFLPLLTDRRLLGKFMVYGEAPRRLSPRELELAQTIAGQVAAAVARKKVVEELAATAQAREKVLAMVSHDLRNPLWVVLMRAELLLERLGLLGDVDATQRGHVNAILQAGRRMHWLIRDLLDMARVDAGNLRLERKPEDVSLLLREAVDLFGLLGATKGHRMEVAGLSPCPAHCDRERVLQILSNLLSNAVRFSPQGGCIRLAAFREGDLVRVSVADEGRGISPEEQPRIFTPFVASDNPRGMGLGLSIVKALVEAHRGTVRVESTPGAGATFSFTLPGA